MPRIVSGGFQKPLERVMIFIDGAYIRRLFTDLFGDDDISFFKMRNSLLKLYNDIPINPFRANLIRTHYYDGIADKKESEYEEHRKYFDSLKRRYLFLTVRLGEANLTSDLPSTKERWNHGTLRKSKEILSFRRQRNVEKL